LVTEYAPLRLEYYVMLGGRGDEKSIYSALDELVALQVLLKSGDDYSFSQLRYIDLLQRNLDDEQRRRIHKRLATAYQSGDYDRQLVLIHHLQQASEGTKALELLIPLLNKMIELREDPFPL